MKLTSNVILFYMIMCVGCTSTPIANKQLTVGKIYKVGYSGKNGATDFIYYFNGIKYTGSTRFRELSHTNMFLLYVDKAKPSNTDIPIPNVKVLLTNYNDSICMTSLGINVEDFRLVLMDENGPTY